MTKPIIETPRGKVIVGEDGKAVLEWNTNFQPKHQKQFTEAQMFVDSEVLRLSEPYTPLKTSMMIKSGTLGTEIGSGMVQWIAPYSRRQYYMKRKVGTQTGPLRGPYWFERMKKVWGSAIIKGAKEIAAKG
jgi:hypothetical protein